MISYSNNFNISFVPLVISFILSADYSYKIDEHMRTNVQIYLGICGIKTRKTCCGLIFSVFLQAERTIL
jgi:hypothetical protein